MALIRYRGRDPFKALDSLMGEINRLFDSSLDIFPRLSEDVFTPSTDVWEDKNNVYVESELPGFDKKDIQVSMKENTLVVSAKKRRRKRKRKEIIIEASVTGEGITGK
jgi:HSP20 family protein